MSGAAAATASTGGLVPRVRAELVAGATADAVARRLGMPTVLVQAVLDRLAAAGEVHCGPAGCPTSRQQAPTSCAGCPLVHVTTSR